MSFKPWIICVFCVLGGSLAFVWYTFRASVPNSEHYHIELINQKSLQNIDSLVEVAIIGSGPAGLSAALYASRMGRYAVVFKGSMPGGQLMGTSDVENWPGAGSQRGPIIMEHLELHVEKFGAQMAPFSIDRVDFTQYPYKLWTDEGKQVNALSVIIATGAYPRKLNTIGEQEYWGRGVSSCAVCDAPFYKDRAVVVVGGGDSAVEQALELSRFARSVTVLVRGSRMRASDVMQKRLNREPHIKILYNTRVAAIKGNNSHVTSIDCVDDKNIPSTLEVEGVFLAVGHEPNTKVFKGSLECDNQGYILLHGRTQATSKMGVFAAGDVADHRYRQAGVASGDGIKAALEADAFLEDAGLDPEISHSLHKQYFDPFAHIAGTSIAQITTSKELDAHLVNEKGPIVVDFYAPYCTSCIAMMPALESVAARLGNQIQFLKTDISLSDELSKRFNITMIPTLVVIQDGKLLSQSTEIMSKHELASYLKTFIK